MLASLSWGGGASGSVLGPRGCHGGGEVAEEAHCGAVECGMFFPEGGDRRFCGGFPAVEGFQFFHDEVPGPTASLAMVGRLDLSGSQGGVVFSEVPYRGGVQAWVGLLDGAAVEGFLILGEAAQFEEDGMAVPSAVDGDVICIEAGGLEGFVPSAEEAGLQ